MVGSSGRGEQLVRIRAAAAQLFVQGFPLLLADAIRRSHPLARGQFYILAPNGAALAPGLVGDDARAVIATAWIDLADEPVVLRLPPTHGRYLMLTLFDLGGRSFASVGSRTGHDGGADIAIVGPAWRGELPSGLSARRAPADSIWVVSRLYAHSEVDQATTVAIAKRQCVAHLAPDAPAPAASLPTLAPPSPAVVRQVANLTPELLMHRLQAITDRVPGPQVVPIRALLEEVTAPLGPAEQHAWRDDVADAMAKGFADGMESIRASVAQASHGRPGAWRAALSNEARWPTSAIECAARAYAAMGAPDREDMLAFSCDQDHLGDPLSGAHSYAIHFPRNGLPPVEAFWWLSALPSSAGSGRHGLGDRNDPVLNRDGSLDILIQPSSPDPDLIRNWLPAPGGQFSLSMRLHWPRTPALSGSWRMPPVERLDSGLAPGRPARGRRPRPSPPSWPDPTRQHREMIMTWRCV